ncbi:MAG: hypothetical protein GEV03_24105 [Streptosporangiales bacterium]|nr:hypothetical protein [Streptosporangiales bacterium]
MTTLDTVDRDTLASCATSSNVGLLSPSSTPTSSTPVRAIWERSQSKNRRRYGREHVVIARIWHATATADGADAYREHFTGSVLPALRELDGHRGAYLLRRDRDGHVELQVITLWESLDAVRRFAGPDVEAAVVEPEARAVLTDFDAKVAHHSVVIDALAASP